ncbi:hypothetical protein HLB42_21840 (plasmid) [Deinococcus sp. D7000]|nr:hypothetical protein HLB42_21840 [Deinococcus sp. D7000]
MKKIFKMIALVATFAFASSAFAGSSSNVSGPDHIQLDGNQTEFAYAA